LYLSFGIYFTHTKYMSTVVNPNTHDTDENKIVLLSKFLTTLINDVI